MAHEVLQLQSILFCVISDGTHHHFENRSVLYLAMTLLPLKQGATAKRGYFLKAIR
jgi:hypothetical protein